MSSPNLQAVYARTSAGDTELASPSNGLSINQRKMLQWADGALTVAEMAERLAAGHTVDVAKLARDVERLQAADLITLKSGGAINQGAGAQPAAKKKGGVPAWAIGVGAVVVIGGVLFMMGNHGSGPVAKSTAPGAAGQDQVAQEEEPKVLGVMPNPARWFSPAPAKPAEAPKPAEKPDAKAADKNDPKQAAAKAATTPAAATPATAAAPAAKPAAPVVAAAPTPAPVVAIPAPVAAVPAQVASAAPAAPKAAPNTKPIFREQPEFPREAATNGVDSGVVRARMSVDENGRVLKVDIVEAKPKHVFDRAVVAALSKWRFQPASSGFSVETEIDFKAD
ncbi:MAG: energy transducer TonB [Burkholderiales bacterium]|nr:energy transducer TonB [Burkholderiales bacterium]